MSVKQIPVSEFKAHCAEELRGVEQNDVSLELTRHGKVIAVIHAPTPPLENNTLLGAGKGTATLSADYDPHEPAFEPSDWSDG